MSVFLVTLEELQEGLATKAGITHTHTAADISNSTAVGRSVVTAVDAPAARAAIGAGTSSLQLGTSPTTAKAGDYAPPAASPTVVGIVEMATTAEAATAADTTRAVTPAGLAAFLAGAVAIEAIQDRIGADVIAGTNVTVTYDDTTGKTTVASTGGGGSSPTVANIPAGSTLTVLKAAGVWPARPTARTDIVVAWKGPDPSPANGVMLDNVDYRLVTP